LFSDDLFQRLRLVDVRLRIFDLRAAAVAVSQSVVVTP
jgi:hypothetical protein